MRPQRLSVSAFGPYATRQDIDFRDLGERSFFLIHGATGAGKTTVLDAICFALYGSTTTDERTGRQMRSDLAAPALMTEVFLDFSVGLDFYRIHRIPEHEVVRKNKSVTQKAQATLWKRTGIADDSADGQLVTAGWKEVTRAIESTLGFQKDQFRQVVVLPQGQFRRLLISTSKERESILEALFKTEYFKSAEVALKQAAGSVTESIKQIAREQENHLAMGGVSSRKELFSRHDETRIDLARTRTELATWQTSLAAVQLQVGEAKSVAARLSEAEQARENLQSLCERQESVEEQRVVLEGALKAAQLSDVEQALRTQEDAAARAQKNVDDAGFALEAATAQFEQAQNEWRAEQDKESERHQCREALRLLNETGAQVSTLDAIAASVDALAREVEACVQARDKTATEIEKRTQQLETLRQKCTQAAQAEERLPDLESVARAAARNLETAKSLAAANRKVDLCQQALLVAEGDLKQQVDLLTAAQNELRKQETAWTTGQAAVLAQSLEPGHACPVCGSEEHPQPATTKTKVPTEALVQQQRQKCKLLETDRDNKRASVSKRQQELSAGESSRDELSRQLEEHGTDVGQLTAVGAEAAAQVEKLRGIMAMHADLVSRLGTAETYMKELDARLYEDKQRHSAANDRWREKLGVLSQLEASVDKEHRDLNVLTRKIKAAKAHTDQLQVAFDRAQSAFHQRREGRAKREAEMAAAQKTLATEQSRLGDACSTFEKKLRNLGFASHVEFVQCQRTADVVKRLEDEVKRFDGALQAAQERNARAQEAARGAEGVDVAALQIVLEETQSRCNGLLKEETHLSRDLDNLELCSKKLEELEDRYGDLEQRYRVLGTIAEVANGDNQLNVTFQRFVLGALLDDVLIAATQRLNIMSKGRYYLQRSITTQDGRKTGGLDLEVTDTFTGTNRAVATLSGGESFLASLSLALGLADVVQSYAGGIHLDTIFVDEGFGTLDPEALDLALRALIDLQKMGRLVGIISHVPELKERIDARLEIVSGRNGSSARFVVS